MAEFQVFNEKYDDESLGFDRQEVVVGTVEADDLTVSVNGALIFDASHEYKTVEVFAAGTWTRAKRVED